MTEQRNLILAVVISIAILIGFHHFYEVPRQERLKQIADAEQEAGGGNAQVAAGRRGDSPSAQVSNIVPGAMIRDRATVLADGSRTKIQNSRITGSLATTGMRFDDLTLSDYFTTLDHTAEVDLLNPGGSEAPYYAVFGWVADDTALALPDKTTRWLPASQADAGKPLTPDHPLALTWDNSHGLTFTRTIAIDANYMFTVTDTVANHGAGEVTLTPYAAVTRQGMPTPGNTGLEGALGMLNGKLNIVPYKKLADNKVSADVATQTSTGGWLGFSDKYWLVVAIPDQAEAMTAEFRYGKTGASEIYQTDYKGAAKVLAPGASFSETSRLFAGAKEVNLLTAYRDDLGIQKFDLAVDWGTFRFLTKPFFYGIDYLGRAIGNFGFGILAFTIIIRILIFPLAWKTFREMNRMADLAPQLAAIKEKHGTDKAGMQVEVMELYKREKVNPVSGCVPMLLQLPIFWSLFRVLSTAIELRQQPFIGYVHDLSAEDPTNIFTLLGTLPEWHVHILGMTLPPHLGILPLCLGFSMLMLQVLGPKIPDPIQRRIMYTNPVVFTFFMAHLPVGLVIYYIFSNMISIVQQRGIRLYYRKRFRPT